MNKRKLFTQLLETTRNAYQHWSRLILFYINSLVWFHWISYTSSLIQPRTRQIAGNQPFLAWKCHPIHSSHPEPGKLLETSHFSLEMPPNLHLNSGADNWCQKLKLFEIRATCCQKLKLPSKCPQAHKHTSIRTHKHTNTRHSDRISRSLLSASATKTGRSK